MFSMHFGSLVRLRPNHNLHLFCSFSSSSVSAPSFSPSLLKKCRTLLQANSIHQQALIQGLFSQFSIHLISTYLALNSPSHSLSLLQRLPPSPSAVFWWNSLILRALRLGLLQQSLSLFRKMLCLGWSPDHYTLPFVFKACGEFPSFRLGTCVHAVVCSSGFESNVFVSNAMVSMYGRCGALDCARQVFDEMLRREVFDLVSWNSMVSAYMQNGDSKKAITLFSGMCRLGYDDDMKPDAVSLVNVLPACASMGNSLCGKQVHGFALRSALFEDLFVANSLVDMYAKCGMMNEANKVFERMQKKDVISWNSMVSGYSQIGNFEAALGLFKRMREEKIELDVVSWSAVISGYAQREWGYEALDVFRQMQAAKSKPNEVTLVSLLSGCASVGALDQGKEAHCYAIKSVLNFDRSDPRDEVLVINAIMDMYTKCKRINVARGIFDSIAMKDNVGTWTVIIGGYAQHGDASEALELFSRMLQQNRSVKPNAYTISCALIACARLAALRYGRQIHAYAIRQRFDSDVIYVANCLIDMYSKSGDSDIARVVFNHMKKRNAVSWISLITGYGIHGHGEEAMKVFDEMIGEGFAPDVITFLVVLYACSHSGMVDQGIKYFDSMRTDFGVTPLHEHYACVVDLLGRAGRFDKALKLIKGMPMEPGPIVWVALLSGCRKHGNVEIGELAANKLQQLDSDNDGSYTLLSNIYANAGRWDDVRRIRALMKNTGIRKRPGCSWVQDKRGTATFFVGDKSHPLSKKIYEVLRELIGRIRVLGYVPETSFALHDVDDEEKDNLLMEHSEKLALAYGILTSAPGAIIRITKNLRICGDCHSAFTYISMIVDHEIILRDASRFHHFKKGSCSCRGYW